MFAMVSRRKEQGGRVAAGSRDASARLVLNSGRGQIVAINVKWLGAFLFAFLAWVMWPEDGYAWWQFRMLSVLTWFGALLATIEAVKATNRYRERRRIMEPYSKLAAQPMGAQLVDEETMRGKEMFHV